MGDTSDPNFTFLAITLAHELAHQRDYNLADIKALTEENSVGLLIELNGLTQEIYIYNQLRNNKKTPAVDKETWDLQVFRLYADIYNYVNGGPRPKQSDFPQLQGIGKKSFDEYVCGMADLKKKGIWSLLRVVEDREGIKDTSLENPPKPSIIESLTHTGKYIELQQYKSIEKTLSLAADEYNKWLAPPAPQAPVTPYVPPAPQQPQPPVQPQPQPGNNHEGGGGGGGGGGHIGGGHLPSAPNWNGG